jgi:putrescine transport system substrate-binding protein
LVGAGSVALAQRRNILEVTASLFRLRQGNSCSVGHAPCLILLTGGALPQTRAHRNFKARSMTCSPPLFRRSLAAALISTIGLAMTGCGSRPGVAPSATATGSAAQHGAAAAEEKVLNVYNWSDYIAPELVPAFEKEYGIKVNYDVFDTNEVLETKLLTGKSGYDIVVPTAQFMAREINAGVFRPLDKSLLPNLKNVDPEVLRQSELFDPGHKYGVNYFISTMGVGYITEKITAVMPGAPVDSLAMVFDPSVIRNFGKCGVLFVDAPDEIVNTVLLYLGRRPNSDDPKDLAAAEKVLMSVRPFVRSLDTFKYINDLANGEVCVALGWSGDVAQAAVRAREAGKNYAIKYNIPKEGAMLFFDLLAIPVDSKHPGNAHLFMDFMLRPEVAARNASYMHYQTTNAAAYPLIDPAVYNDKSIYPSAEEMARLSPALPRSQSYTRALTRMWTRFKTGH